MTVPIIYVCVFMCIWLLHCDVSASQSIWNSPKQIPISMKSQVDISKEVNDILASCPIRVQSLLSSHFSRQNAQHPNEGAARLVLCSFGAKPITLVETGTSAWGFDSTRLWDRYVRRFGGLVLSVDKRSKAKEKLTQIVGGLNHSSNPVGGNGNSLPDGSDSDAYVSGGPVSNHTHLYVQDSVEFLKGIHNVLSALNTPTETDKTTPTIALSSINANSDINARKIIPVNVWFFDSWDVDWKNSYGAAMHGWNEFRCIEKQGLLRVGDLVWIDDTPIDRAVLEQVQRSAYYQGMSHIDHFEQQNGVLPGKGAYIMKYINNTRELEHAKARNVTSGGGDSGGFKVPKRRLYDYDVLYHRYSVILRVRAVVRELVTGLERQ